MLDVISLYHAFCKGLVVLQLPTSIQSTTLLIILLCVLIILSFSIAGSQAAIFSLEAEDVDVLKTKQQTSAKRIITLLEEPKEVFTSMLLAKTVINICIIVLSNYLINQYVPHQYLSTWWSISIKFALIAFSLLFLVEIFPRIWATQNNLRFALEWSILIAIVEAIHYLLRRISHWAVSLEEFFGVGANKVEEKSIQDLDEAIDIEMDKDVSAEEKSIMKGIVKFGNISVKTVMRSRLYVSGIEYNTPFNELITKIEELHYSRLPVYKGDLDDIAGILNTKDLVQHVYSGNADFDWRSVIRPPYFVPESKSIEDLLIDFQKMRVHFAIVVDEFGGTSGIITMEDIMEEVIGDIKDEFDEEDIISQKIDDSTYIFEGITKLHDMCKVLKIPLSTFDEIKGQNETLGGLIIELFGELPKNNDVIKTGDFEFTVLETEKNRIKNVQVKIFPPN